MTSPTRTWAPVAAPPPPKPAQLNIIASALMPDVATDVFGPDGDPELGLTASARARAGWLSEADPVTERRRWDVPPGDTLYRETAERRNALVASVGVMSDLELKQVEQEAGVTVDSMPSSIFPATLDTRWTGGFRYAPENQYAAQLADPCGQTIDLPAFPAPTGLVAAGATGGTLTTDSTHQYEVTGVNANGETVPSSAVNITLTGSQDAVKLTWGATPGITMYKVYGRVSGSLGLLATVTQAGSNSPSTVTYTDLGSPAPGVSPPSENTTGGPGNYGNLPQVAYVPFLIQVEDECSTWGWEERDFTGRALRLLDNATPNAIERELWSGAFAQNTLTGPMDGTNAFLTQSDDPTTGGTGVAAVDLTPASTPTIPRGIQILEDYLANSGLGGQGVLHVAPETSPNLLGARRVGALFLSVMDNIIVPGSGYPTSGDQGPIGNDHEIPADGEAWIFCSDLVSIRLDDPMTWPSTMAEATDRGDFGQPNTVRIRAQRFAAVTWDVARLAATRVKLPS